MTKESKIFPRVFAKCIAPLLLTPIVIAEQTALKNVIEIILQPRNKGFGTFDSFSVFSG